MKLLTKTTLYISTLSLFLFFCMGVLFFQVLKNLGLSELNRELEDLRKVLSVQIPGLYPHLPAAVPGVDSLSVQRTASEYKPGQRFGDTLMLDHQDGQYKTFRYIEYVTAGGEDSFLVRIYKSTTPTDKLVERVTLMMTGMVILFLAGLFIMNRFIFANLWKDFFDALEKLKEFDTSKEPVLLGDQDIEEFIELKKVLEKMTRRLASDYRELKEYTDHTTHELQTPLAVIKTKIDLLLQSSQLGPGEMNLIQGINESVNHLSRLNSTLALMTRIENQQFTEQAELSLTDLADRHVGLLQELIEMKELSLHRKYAKEPCLVNMDQGLADILMANLLKNAVVHGEEKGEIVIRIGPGQLEIANDGRPLPFDEQQLFRRFVRNARRTSNFGLGLSLVRKICEHYGFAVAYRYEEGKHWFTLTLK